MTGSGQVSSNIGMEGDAHFATLHARSSCLALGACLFTQQPMVFAGSPETRWSINQWR